MYAGAQCAKPSFRILNTQTVETFEREKGNKTSITAPSSEALDEKKKRQTDYIEIVSNRCYFDKQSILPTMSVSPRRDRTRGSPSSRPRSRTLSTNPRRVSGHAAPRHHQLRGRLLFHRGKRNKRTAAAAAQPRSLTPIALVSPSSGRPGHRVGVILVLGRDGLPKLEVTCSSPGLPVNCFPVRDPSNWQDASRLC